MQPSGRNCSCIAGCRSYPPLLVVENSLSGRDNGRDGLIRTQSRLRRLGDSRGFAERLEGKISDLLPFPEIRAENRRFHNLFTSLITALSHKGSAKVTGISCRDALSVWRGFRGLFFETGTLSACLGFFDPRVFPLGSAWKVRF
jgi:hypothetical protein